MDRLADLFMALRFFSRLPVPTTRRETAFAAHGLAEAAVMAPLAGATIGLLPALPLTASLALGLPASLAAGLAIASLVVITGALHEDGLADCADGFGGGRTRERKLAIMRDSRIGTFGACAIALSLYLRGAALAIIATNGTSGSIGVLVAAAALSRAACLVPLGALEPARSDGMGAGVRPRPRTLAIAWAIAVGLAFGVLLPHAGLARISLAIVLAALATLGMCALARRQIGGQTGDVAGATQQIVEIVIYLVFAAA